MRRLERGLLALVCLFLGAAYAFLSEASRAAPHALDDQILAVAWPHWAGALWILGSVWTLHIVLTLRRSPGDQVLLPMSTLLIGLGWLEILRVAPDAALRQSAWVVIGTAFFLVWMLAVRDYRPLQDYRTLLLAGAIGLQAMVMMFGTEVNGARLWLRFGPLSFQPVEVVKILLVLFLASYLRDYRELLSVSFLKGRLVVFRYLIPLLILMAGCEAIFAVQKDLGIGLLLFGVFTLLFFVTTRRFDFVLLGMGMFSVLAWECYQVFPHVRVRFLAWIDPWPGAQSWGFQMVQALYALANGGLTGAGLGLGQPWQIPEVHTDFIFVALTEELGLIGAAAIVLVYIVLVQRAFRIASEAIRTGEDFGGILAWGLGATLLCQSFIVIAGTVKMAPMTGITLPFVSYGGSSLLTNYLLLAILMQISERTARTSPAVWTPGRVRLRRTVELTSKACLLFLLLPLAYLTYFDLTSAQALAAAPDNPRNREDLRLRGGFVDRAGVWLARTDKSGLLRVYPQGELTVHTIGYEDGRYGLAGLEASQDRHLRGPGLPRDPQMAFDNVRGTPLSGPDAVVTLDMRLQKLAAAALGQRRGAVVALDPRTGDILVSVSRPGFDPNHLDQIWGALNIDPAAPLIDRARDGYYPPGSVFKLLTLAAALGHHDVAPTDTFLCPGYLDVNGYRLHCNQGEVHGSISVQRALAESCNVTFAQIALRVGSEEFTATMHRLLPQAHLAGPRSDTELAQMGFGQGSLGVSPLDMARLVQIIANGGRPVEPRLVRAWRTGEVTVPTAVVMGEPVLADDVTRTISAMMETVVTEGTGAAGRIEGVRVAGKTGTAENPQGAPHAWFAAFAPADDPKLVVVALVENAGYGGDVAAPIVRQVLEAALGKKVPPSR